MMMRFQMTTGLLLAAMPAIALAQGAATPARTPQPIPKAAFVQRVDAAFASVDANKDGSVDKAEIEAAETKTLAARKAAMLTQREAAFKELDRNKDGSLTLTEFNAPLVAQALPKADAAPMLAQLDTNKDGKISAAENRAPAVVEFDRADANKDGTISLDEQKAASANK
jgi:hypothetical protein